MIFIHSSLYIPVLRFAWCIEKYNLVLWMYDYYWTYHQYSI